MEKGRGGMFNISSNYSEVTKWITKQNKRMMNRKHFFLVVLIFRIVLYCAVFMITRSFSQNQKNYRFHNRQFEGKSHEAIKFVLQLFDFEDNTQPLSILHIASRWVDS